MANEDSRAKVLEDSGIPEKEEDRQRSGTTDSPGDRFVSFVGVILAVAVMGIMVTLVIPSTSNPVVSSLSVADTASFITSLMPLMVLLIFFSLIISVSRDRV